MCKQAPAVRAVLRQADERWPHREDASDGICASPKHTKGNPGSDHEPHVNGYATAVDLTDDKTGGCDADEWAEHLRRTRDSRIKYVICNRRMFSSYSTKTRQAWEWGPYTGSNPHEKHTHLSILPTALFDTSPWFPPSEEDDMTDEDRQMLRELHAAVCKDSDAAPSMARSLAETYYRVMGLEPGKGLTASIVGRIARALKV